MNFTNEFLKWILQMQINFTNDSELLKCFFSASMLIYLNFHEFLINTPLQYDIFLIYIICYTPFPQESIQFKFDFQIQNNIIFFWTVFCPSCPQHECLKIKKNNPEHMQINFTDANEFYKWILPRRWRGAAVAGPRSARPGPSPPECTASSRRCGRAPNNKNNNNNNNNNNNKNNNNKNNNNKNNNNNIIIFWELNQRQQSHASICWFRLSDRLTD